MSKSNRNIKNAFFSFLIFQNFIDVLSLFRRVGLRIQKREEEERGKKNSSNDQIQQSELYPNMEFLNCTNIIKYTLTLSVNRYSNRKINVPPLLRG